MSLIDDATGYPFRLQLEQYELTQLVVERLGDFPHVDVRFDHEVTGYADRGDCVECIR